MNIIRFFFFSILLSTLFFPSNLFCGKDPVAEAKSAITNHDYQTAISKLRDAYEDRDNRKRFDVNFLFAQSFYNLELPDSSIIYYIKAREIAPESTVVYIGLGDSYVKKSLALPAIQQYEKAISIDSSLIPIQFKIAKLYRTQRDYKNAANAFLQVIKRDSMNVDAYTQLADIFTLAKQFGNAARMYKRLTVLKPNEVELQVSLMRALVNAHANNEAIPAAETIIAKDSANFEAHRILANAYFETRNYPSSEKEFLLLQRRDTLSSDEVLRLAKSQNNNKKQLDAIKTFEQYLSNRQEDSSLIEVYGTLGTLYMSNQMYDSAITMFQHRIHFDSSAISAYMNSGICAMQLKKYDKAIPFFELVIAKKPEYVKGHLYLARCYALKGESFYDEEGKSYKKMVEIIGDTTANYKSELAEAYGFDGFINFSNGSKIAKDDPPGAEKLYAKGVSSLKIAISFDSASVSNNLMLGQLYQNMNKIDEAIKQYKIVLKLDQKNEQAKKGIELLEDLKKKKK